MVLVIPFIIPGAATRREHYAVARSDYEESVAAEVALPAGQVRLALDFYAAHPAEIDRRIAADDDAATRARALIDRRERLLSQ